MRSAWKVLSSVALTVLVLVACRPEPRLGPTWNGGTPYPLDVPDWVTVGEHLPYLPEDPPLTVEVVDLGRRLFYEKALSNDFAMSCASCHRQEHAFTDPRQFSLGTDGSVGTRNAMAIFDLAWDGHFFWDGRSISLEQQAFLPVVDHAEMRNTWPVVEERLRSDQRYPELFRNAFGSPGIDSLRVVQAIAQFERTLLSFDSRYDRFSYGGDSSAITAEEQRGMDLYFRGAHCGDCHTGPLFGDHALRNNGLDLVHSDLGLGAVTGNANHNGLFKATSLRNIAVTAPYMHDGRSATLEEVVDFYADDVQLDSPDLDNRMFPWMAGQVNLTQQDRADLVASLHTLTDERFLTNPAFAHPN